MARGSPDWVRWLYPAGPHFCDYKYFYDREPDTGAGTNPEAVLTVPAGKLWIALAIWGYGYLEGNDTQLRVKSPDGDFIPIKTGAAGAGGHAVILELTLGPGWMLTCFQAGTTYTEIKALVQEFPYLELS